MTTTPNSIITPQTPNLTFGAVITAANTAKDGTGVVVNAFTAGVNGAKCDAINIMPLGTNIATVMRIFLNNGGVNSNAANNSLFKDITLPATTNSETSSVSNNISVPIGLMFPAGAKINVTLGTAVAAGFSVFGSGGDL